MTSNNNINGHIFNIGSGKSISILSLAQTICDDYVFIEKRDGEAKHTLAKNDKAKEILGWMPLYKKEDYIKNILEEYDKKNKL
jgi:nucleoside-diphosphate-sugar epimerase